MTTLDRMERLYSRKYGLANETYPLHRRNKAGLSVSTDCSYTLGNIVPAFYSTVGSSKKKIEGSGGGAASLNYEKSKIKAYGEFLERDCAFVASSDLFDVVFESQDSLMNRGEAFLDFGELIHYESHHYDNPEFSLSKYCSASPITWIKGKDMVNGNSVWLPAQKVFIGFPFPKEEKICIKRLSTGLACGSSFAEATLSGVLEVIERDSFMLTWCLQLPGKRVEMDDITNNELQELYFHINKFLVGEDKLHIYDISRTTGVYTIMAFIRNDLPSAYGLIVSCASHTDPQVALLKSLEELCQSQNFAYHSLYSKKEMNMQNMTPDDIDNLHKHFFYYSTGRHTHNIDFISKTNEYVLLSEMYDNMKHTVKNSLEYVAETLHAQRLGVFIADVTNPETVACGFHVVKAIIPGAVDLDVSQKFKQHNNTRLKEKQGNLGVKFNENPHPFP